MKLTHFFSYSLCILGALLSACTSIAPNQALLEDGPPLESPPPLSSLKDAVPKKEAPSPYGNPSSYSVLGKRHYVLESSHDYSAKGIASWYGRKFHGRRTSSGELYDMHAMTAAHRNLPIPSYVKVENLDNGKEVIVKINDRGPFVANRLIDLSYGAARKLGIHQVGVAPVRVTAVAPAQYRTHQALAESKKSPESQPTFPKKSKMTFRKKEHKKITAS